MSLNDGMSVIVCCYNSAPRLFQTLKYLACQQVDPDLLWEVILVDNASSDNTSAVAEAAWTEYNIEIDFTIVRESRPGLSYARDKGIKTAKFGLVVFCDDDNWLHKDYIRCAYNILSADPTIGALGGRSEAVSETGFPAWFESEKNNYAVGEQAFATGDVTSRMHLWGCGLVIRKQLYIAAFSHFPSILTGRRANELSSGEDSEICMRFILMGYRLYYSAALKLYHFIPQNRLNERYNRQLIEGFIQAHRLLSIYTRLIHLRSESFFQKNIPLLKSLLRITAGKIFRLQRWNLGNDVVNVYLISGWKLGAISEEMLAIRHFSEKYGNYR